jgi:N utilization substance protein B
MAARHRSRHRAVQILYQCDLRDLAPDEAIQNFYEGLYSEEHEDRPDQDSFMEDLVRGAVNNRDRIDERIAKFSEHWRIERMAAVDRNILRLAVHELLEKSTPPAVVIDEALQLARRFSGEDSIPFINGVLDAVHKELSP